MKLLLAESVDETRELDLRQPSLGLAYLTAMVRRELPGQVEVRATATGVEQAIRQWRPDVVGISSTSVRYGIARQNARVARDLGIPVIIGGIHITALPESLYPEMDVGVLGEGETAIVELMRLYLETGGLPPERLRDIPGLVFRDGGELVRTPPRPHMARLDDIPPPDRTVAVPQPHSHLFSSRGCPYSCVFCASTRFWPGKVRFFSAERVVDEVEQLVRDHHVKVISFYDDLFVANLERLARIRDLLVERGLVGKVRFTCNARANIVTDRMCELLKAIGVASVNMGLESGCQKTLTYLKGGNVTVEQNREAIMTVRRHGMLAQGSFIIGAPDETREEIEETYQFIRRMPLSILDVYILRPYPGTPIWDYAVERGLASNDMQWGSITHRDRIDPERLINLSNHISSDEMARIYARFMRLRYWKILKGLVHHPYRMEIVSAGLRAVHAMVAGWFRPKDG
ncbi:MAG TPA: radical SAM protein [Phycisphaerae bacterium]|nr:radical SAM protein [Phycisphaerae bacterium]